MINWKMMCKPIALLIALGCTTALADTLTCPNGKPLKKGMTLENVNQTCHDSSYLKALPTISKWKENVTYTAKYPTHQYIYFIPTGEDIARAKSALPSASMIASDEIQISTVQNHITQIISEHKLEKHITLCGIQLVLNEPAPDLKTVCGKPSIFSTYTPKHTVTEKHATLSIQDNNKLSVYHFINNKLTRITHDTLH